ncbi:hypothetical protein [Bradyrhizobium sp. SZCCHNS3004]|uniref:hypothetical protein n=1 Tax=Bradyrhizobium sp. SZCCHNS3004 TaxID=3057312 RepID=UPI0029168C92|nr:hypothetical protein [Bradyrhizobium sp. SZCCHNS3004]
MDRWLDAKLNAALSRPIFIADKDGRIVFYLNGPCFSGYVVPTSQIKISLLDAIDRFKGMELELAQFTVPIAVVCIWSLTGKYGSFALTVLTIVFVVQVAGRALQKHLCFGELIRELDRVRPLDYPARWLNLTLLALIVVTYCSYVIGRIVAAFS